MAAAGAKPAIKRTAFGDVSNTFRANQATRDTSVPTSKQQPIQLQLEKKSVTTLQQPAQRPTSLATGLKELITHSVVSTKPTAEAFPKVPSTSAAHRALSRKNTTVFKDYTTSSKPADDQLNIRETTKADTALAPWSRNIVLNASNTSIAPKASEPERDLKTKSIPSVKAARVEPITQGPAATQNTGVRSSAGFVQSSVADIQAQLATGSDRALKQHVPSLRKTPLPTTLSVEQPGKASAKKTNGAVEIVAVKNVPLPVAEPEEHWDVDYEEEEDNYEDEAYVTARSFRSRGDNLTGNVTTTIVLKTNIKVRKELEAAAAVVQLSRPITELEDEAWDVTMVSEYKEEIFDYFKELEVRSDHTKSQQDTNLMQVKFAPKPHYMDFQTEIQWSMRAVLMDWVVQVHHRFQLLPETLFLCANLIDRFLSCKVVSLGKLQLVGATAIFIASKYEEINCPSVGEIVYMVDNGYSVEEVLKAERFMLTMLQFDLGWPGPMSFLRRISTADDYDLETRTLAKYFLEITIMDERFLGCPPSFTAAGAHCLARSMLKKGHWVCDSDTKIFAITNSFHSPPPMSTTRVTPTARYYQSSISCWIAWRIP